MIKYVLECSVFLDILVLCYNLFPAHHNCQIPTSAKYKNSLLDSFLLSFCVFLSYISAHLVFAWTRKTQILGRCNQRLSGKLSNPQFPLIVRQFHLTGLCLLPQFYSIPRPLLKLNGGHFLFQVAGIVRFICAIVRKPDGIIFAFIVIPFAGTNIAAGFSGLVFQRAIAAAGILSCGK